MLLCVRDGAPGGGATRRSAPPSARTSPPGSGSGRPVEVRQNVGREGLDLRAGLARVADRVEDEVFAAGVDELLECLEALPGGPVDAVPLAHRPQALPLPPGRP